MKKDFYKTLGIEKNATTDEIKKAYRKLARIYHPDIAGKDKSAEEKFKEINEAYEVLSDERKRSAYDQFGSAGPGFGPGGGFDPSGFDFSNFQGSFSDIFDTFFGGSNASGRTRRGPRRGNDIEISIHINFNEACFGISKSITINRAESCTKCDGAGHPSSAKESRCNSCDGTGIIKKVQNTILGQVVQQHPCDDCQGEGKSYSQTCKACHGRGRERKERKIDVEIPAGVDNGSVIRLKGQGEAGLKGGPTGDLYVHLEVMSSRKFKRKGQDIYTELDIQIPQAVIGDEIDIETIHGKKTLKIPAGTQSGHILKLKNLGINKINSTTRGDHLIHIKVNIPSKVSEKDAKLYKELADSMGLKIKPAEKTGFWKKLFSS